MREKDLSDDDQCELAISLLPIARRHGGCLTLHGEAVLANACGADGVHLSAGSDPVAARRILGPDKLVGVSVHTVTEAEALDPAVIDYAIAGPAFETASKPGYGPAIGRKGLAEIAAATPVPCLPSAASMRCGRPRCSPSGPPGIAVMGSVMRSPDPGGEVRGLLSVLAEARRQAVT